MGRNTRQRNLTIKELRFGANAPSTTSFVRQHFQEVCRLHSFNQALCLHHQVMSPQQVPVVCLPLWCQYHAVTLVSYMYFPSPCSARTCTTLWIGLSFSYNLFFVFRWRQMFR